MAIVPYLGHDDVEQQYQHLLARPINLFTALINSPDGFAHFHAFAEWIRWDASLDPRLRELAILLVGYLTGDEYEWSHHLRLRDQFGVTDGDVAGLIAFAESRPSSLGNTERLVLEATRQLTNARGIDDDVVARLTAEFSNAEVTELVLITAFYSMVVRVLGGLRIEVEPEYRLHLEQFPLPQPRGLPRPTAEPLGSGAER